MDYNSFKEFNKYVYWLGNSIPKHMQDEALNYFLNNCKEEDVQYIISTTNPYTWDKAILVLKEIGYPKNKSATYRIMYLFQDINWLCAKDAFDVIYEIYSHEPEIVIKAIEDIAKLADKDSDTEWLFGLSSVKERLKISKNDFADKETINILYKGEFWDSFEEIT